MHLPGIKNKFLRRIHLLWVIPTYPFLATGFAIFAAMVEIMEYMADLPELIENIWKGDNR